MESSIGHVILYHDDFQVEYDQYKFINPYYMNDTY